MTTLETMRDALITDLKAEVGASVQVVREGVDFGSNFPTIVLQFMGPSIKRHMNGLSRSTDGTRDNWTMEEPLRVYIYTLENIDGEDTSRAQLQELVDQVEFYIRKDWPELLRTYQCALWYGSSFGVTTRRSFYGDNGLNEAIMRIGIQEPRYPTTATDVPGPDAETILITSAPMDGTSKRLSPISRRRRRNERNGTAQVRITIEE